MGKMNELSIQQREMEARDHSHDEYMEQMYFLETARGHVQGPSSVLRAHFDRMASDMKKVADEGLEKENCDK